MIEEPSSFKGLLSLNLGCDDSGEETLPRGLPYVGFRRHAPPQPPRRCERGGKPYSGASRLPSDGAAKTETAVVQRSQLTLLRLLRESPYVGSRCHAPPSPTLNFSRCAALLAEGALDLLPPPLLGAAGAEDGSAAQPLPSGLPEGVWAASLSWLAEVPAVPSLARVARCFAGLVRNPGTWQGRRVRVGPGGVPGLAPKLRAWLSAWRLAARLVVPRSAQLLAEVARLAPHLEVEVAWRFDARAKGEGLEVVRNGAAVRRVGDGDEEVDEVVVLGDAPLVARPGRGPYVEVRLEALAAVPAGDDNVNDFGIGFTACEPEELDMEEHFAVASEVPKSWVVDFAQSAVCLNINNSLDAKGRGLCAGALRAGDRVGVQLSPADCALEVFLNGQLRERLCPGPGRAVPRGSRLFPVVDLYGRVTEISCTDAEGPAP